MPILNGMPFLGWWMLLFVGWSLLVGPLVFRFVNAANSTDLKHPARLFLALFGLLVVSLFITGGSLLLPFILVVPFWIAALVSGIRCQAPGWRKFCITMVGVMLLVVPVSYAFPMVNSPTHGTRVAKPRAVPTVPTGAPTVTPAVTPTLQDALPVEQRSPP
ncbi:MAG: hypothetical protein H0W78_13525 [Planctomycetes bacterium]|nr:hypothetical protein [Planctomycetota bacterium]